MGRWTSALSIRLDSALNLLCGEPHKRLEVGKLLELEFTFDAHGERNYLATWRSTAMRVFWILQCSR